MKSNKNQTAPLKFLEAMREFKNPKNAFPNTPIRLIYMRGFEGVKGQNPFHVFYTNALTTGEVVATK